MLLMGDVLFVVATILAIAVTNWAMIMAIGLLFPGRARDAQAEITENPWKCLVRGSLLGLPLALFALVLMGIPFPIAKLAGVALMVVVLGIAALGSAGLAMVAGERLQELAPEMPVYGVFSRGAGFIVASSILPFLGWFGFGPIALVVSLGAGLKVIRAKAPVRVIG